MKQIKQVLVAAVFASLGGLAIIYDATAMSSGALSLIQNEEDKKADTKGDHDGDHAGTKGEEEEESCH